MRFQSYLELFLLNYDRITPEEKQVKLYFKLIIRPTNRNSL